MKYWLLEHFNHNQTLEIRWNKELKEFRKANWALTPGVGKKDRHEVLSKDKEDWVDKIKANNSDVKEQTYRNPQKRVNISRTYDSTLQIGVDEKTGIV